MVASSRSFDPFPDVQTVNKRPGKLHPVGFSVSKPVFRKTLRPPRTTDVLITDELINDAALAAREKGLKKVLEYMLEEDPRIMHVLSGVIATGKWLDEVRNWKSPVTALAIHFLFSILIMYPVMVLPALFGYLFLNPWNSDTDGLSQHAESDRLRVAGTVETAVRGLATQGEKLQSLISWRNPRDTAIFAVSSLLAAAVLQKMPFRVVALLVGLYVMRHPMFRSKLPSLPAKPADTSSLKRVKSGVPGRSRSSRMTSQIQHKKTRTQSRIIS